MCKKIVCYIQTICKETGFCFSLSWKTSPLYTMLRILCNIILPISTTISVLMGKYLLDAIVKGTGGIEDSGVVAYIIVIMLVGIVEVLCKKIAQYAQTMHEGLLEKELTEYIMGKACMTDFENFDNAEYYNMLTASMYSIPGITGLLWNVLTAVSNVTAFVLAFSVLGQTKLEYGMIILIAAVPSSIVSLGFTRQVHEMNIRQIKKERKKGYFMGLAVERRYAQDIRLYNLAEFLKMKYRKEWQQVFSERKQTIKCQSVWKGLLECLPEIIIAWMGLDIVRNIMSGKGTLGDYSLYMGLLSQLWGSIEALTGSLTQMYDNQLKIDNLKGLEGNKNSIENNGKRELKEIMELTFCNVSFCYPGTDKKILEEVSFTIEKGDKIAFVGKNGSGKSTIVKLLLRLYDVEEGQILINGYDIKEYKIEEVRKQFAVYFQEAPCYSMSWKENITMSDREKRPDEKEIREIIQASDMTQVLEKAPKGMDTQISKLFDKTGLELSGGQYQKLALERTLYREHSVLVLDEPSSNLDPLAEKKLFHEWKKAADDKIFLFISHHMTNIASTDRVIVLEAGRIIEDGVAGTLAEQGGYYAKLLKEVEEK